MAFTLRWKNDNPAGSVVKVYRGTAKLVPTSLPEPLAVLSNGEETFTDTTVVLNTGYYYLLTVTVGSRTVTGPQKYIVIKNRRGIGPIDLKQAGDTDDLAYLGGMDYVEQFTYNALPAGLRALTGFSGDGGLNMFKFLHRGRILYTFPYGRFHNKLISWNDIYNAGLMYGMDGFGPEGGHPGLPDIDQGGLFDWQGDTYRVRSLRGLTDVGEPTLLTLPDSLHGVDHDTTEYGRCEYNDLLYPFCDWMPDKQPNANWGYVMTYSFFNYATTWTGAGFLCQERDPDSGKVLMRGSAPATSPANAKIDLTMIKLIDPAAAAGYFVPVIELME
ncbi:putative virion structural protein [Erwinia phage vB_EamM_ChrisDB]|uniref:putative virion structural protein n=1 Tax=Erwinia phage vB_EamM_ChrisDB TaxID=1883371 RepID=UPI00081D1D3D|nr:putative virion structural protein [Erwinia phage vB_EamM_ChrisDB]ANZ48728.1 putative virion structural protein [Erwinia phage vB_EamM_ChrisDB]